MGEPTPPLAIYPAPKKPRPPKGGSSDGVQRALFLMVGLIIGGTAVGLVFLSRHSEPKIVYQAPAGSSPPVQSLLQQPKTGEPSDLPHTPPANQAAKPPADAAKAPANSKPPGIQPFNPFDGSLAAPMPAKEIDGHITAGPGVRLPAISEGGPSGAGPVAAEAPPTPKGLLLTVRLDVADTNAAVKALQAVASKEGGSAIQFDELAAKPDAEGAVIFVPAAKAGEAEKEIGAVGNVIVSDRWSGPSSDRLDRIEQTAVDHLSDLRVQRQELLIKYFDDAPQIKHIDEDTDRINKCLAALRARRPGADVAVIKVRFLT
ncbi:MAG TPA: hypothetical protein VG820_10195 [Fimbriimonadaceae bacterium]|nr:hypothetical protein [Fimbriimonadaceae bacterium]